ncbi:MAG: hypothetical protein ABEL51_08805 [Salinibacter sp.]
MVEPFVRIGLALFLTVAAVGCGLVGWQGEPPTRQSVTVTGTMQEQMLGDRGPLWTIETDTALYVPRSEVPSQVKEEELRVQASGVLDGSPDFYPQGYYLEINVITPLEN